MSSINESHEKPGHLRAGDGDRTTAQDFAGKTVRVISTHEGSGTGCMVSDVKKLVED